MALYATVVKNERCNCMKLVGFVKDESFSLIQLHERQSFYLSHPATRERIIEREHLVFHENNYISSRDTAPGVSGAARTGLEEERRKR